MGILQGFTEFLPISSSGHLVVAQHYLGIVQKGVLLEVVLHMGTLVSIIIYFYNDIKNLLLNVFKGEKDARSYIQYLIIATIPAAISGLILKNSIETFFSIYVVKWMFVVTACIVASTYFFNNKKEKKIIWSFALIIGLSQVFALLPGISRSGITIATAIFLGINHDKAAKFAFYMAIPILFGAAILQYYSLSAKIEIFTYPLLVGFISSALSGYLVINFLLKIISKGKFHIFSIYLFILSFYLFLFNI